MEETLVDALRPKALLLLLDNCEHLLAACRDLAAALLHKCLQSRILATSREGLGVPGETIWRVPSLSVPEDISHLPAAKELVLYDAVRLFVDRAVATTPGFTVTSENAPAVARVCQRLDGIPLAIELAAARIKVLAVEQIAARLDDRFRLLTGGSPIALPRHQTLRAAIDWSYNLLSEPERIVLQRLSVFVGGWTLEAAESVCVGGSVEAAEILDRLTSLVDKSLVLVETQRAEARYRLLETVRQYSLSKLLDSGEADDVRRRYRNWYLTLAEQARPQYFGAESALWLERLQSEHDNLRAAVEWSRVDKDGAEAGLRLAGTLWWFLVRHGDWSEAREWLEGALARSAEAPPTVLPWPLAGVSNLAFRRGDYALAMKLGAEGLALSRELGDKEASAVFLYTLGSVAERQRDPEQANALLTESLSISRELGNQWLCGDALNGLGHVAQWLQGSPERAIELHTESLAEFREAGDVWGIALTLRSMGMAAHSLNDCGRAANCFRESLVISSEAGDRWLPAECLEGLARVASAEGYHDRAARLFGTAEVLHETLGWHPSPFDQAYHDRYATSTRANLGEVSFARAWAEGRAMTLEQAIWYALAAEE